MIPSLFVILISTDEAVRLHDAAIEQFGGRPGLINLGLLESAMNQPLMMIEFGMREEHKMYNLAAAYFYHIIKNHPFQDGNKRTGLIVCLNFLHYNGYEVRAEFDELYQLALDTASSKINKKDVVLFFKRVVTRSN